LLWGRDAWIAGVLRRTPAAAISAVGQWEASIAASKRRFGGHGVSGGYLWV
jgi:hypothetical protein